jgi:predicted DNA-binding antitoxin AbrB/MazE fold protein
MSIDAVFENGVFRPVQPVHLPERTAVEIEFRVNSKSNGDGPNLDQIYAILGERFQSGHSDTASRHNEHQP